MKQAFAFSIKVWLTAVFLAPAIIIGIQTLQHNYNLTSWFAYMVGIIVGILYSLPSVIFLVIASYQVRKRNMQKLQAKMVLSVAGVLLAFLALMLCIRKMPSYGDETLFLAVYVSVIVVGVWLYKLKPMERDVVVVVV